MTDRGLPSVDSAQACPFVAFEHDRDERATSPDHRHRCYAEARPAPRAIAHQEAYCLSSAFPVCPTFQDWARREAARARGAGIGAAATAAPAAPAIAASPRDLPRSSSPGAWPQAPSFAGRDSGRSPIEPYDDREGRERRDEPGDIDDEEAEEDRDDRGAAVFPAGRTEPGSGLAGSRADRLAMAGGAADPAGARPAWPTQDDLSAGRRGGADDWPSTAGAIGAAGAAGAAAGAAGAAGAGAGAAGASRDADFERDYDARDREPRTYDARDYPHRDERVEPADGGRKGLFGRGGDKRPRVGDTRRGRDDEPAPSWEQPRRSETYPAVKTRRSLRGLSRVLLAALLLFGAAIAVFFLPQLLIKGPTSPATGSPSPSATTAAEASASVEPTPQPTPTPFTYTVAPRDTLTKIAKRFGVTVDQIVAANPAIKDPNKVNIGDKLVIPTPGPSGGASPSPSP